MGGLLTHLVIAFALFWIGVFLFKKNKWKYFFGIAFVVGHLTPDLIDFGITGFFNGTLNPVEIIKIPLFNTLWWLGHTFLHWVIFGIIVITILFGLYKFRKISKNKFIDFVILFSCFIVGVTVHLVIDILIIEKSYWI